MTEGAKTLTFVGVAVGLLAVAVATRPRAPSPAQVDRAGDLLNEVDDPLSATRLQVIKFNEETSSISKFEVAQVDGRWVIPSHQDYPADAEQHMAEAAMSVMNLKILDVAATNPADHATYGVIDPDIEELTPGAVGVGSRVTMQDGAGEQLVNMVIGKEVKGEPGQRYVREADRDPVYIVPIDAEKLTTRFEDWIEKDLLKISPYDIAELTLNDYSVELGIGATGLQVQWDRRGEMTFAYSDTDAKWAADELKVFDLQKQAFDTVTLAADEEVNSEKLNDMKNALDDLKIVDVERKPDGLSQDLKAGKDFATDREAVQNLAERGFMPVQVGADSFEILSTDGEVLCQMKDGVEYVLRFGKIVLGSEGGEPKPSADKDSTAEDGQAAEGSEAQEDADAEGGSEINRYIFVTTRFNPDAIERPTTEELPELPEGAAADDADDAGETTPEGDQEKPAATDAAPPEGSPTTATTPAAPPDAGSTPAADASGGPDADPGSGEEDAAGSDSPESAAASRPIAATRVVQTAYQAADTADDAEAAAGTQDAGPDDAAAADESTAGATPSDQKAADDDVGGEDVGGETAADAETGTKEPADGEATGEDKETQPAATDTASADEKTEDEATAGEEKTDLDALIARRKEIETENQRKLDEYNDKIKKGKERVAELNQRFGDWYYVISDTVFQKIHLNRDDVIKKKEKEEDEAASGGDDQAEPIAPAGPVGRLNELEQGLNQPPPKTNSNETPAEETQEQPATTEATDNPDSGIPDSTTDSSTDSSTDSTTDSSTDSTADSATDTDKE